MKYDELWIGVYILRRTTMGKTNSNTAVPTWRRVLSIVLALISTAMIVYSSLTMALKDSFSKKNINRVCQQIDFLSTYGDIATDVINVGIMHLTDSAYTENLYLTPERLNEFFNETTLRSFIVNKLYEFSEALTRGKDAYLSSAEIAELLKPIVVHIEDETGIIITDNMLIKEVSKAIGGYELITMSNIQIIHPTIATVLLVIGVILLLLSFVLGLSEDFMWHDIIASCIVIALCILIICAFLFLASGLISRIDKYVEGISLVGDKLLNLWIQQTRSLFARRGVIALLSLVLPIGMILICLIDKRIVMKDTMKWGRR